MQIGRVLSTRSFRDSVFTLDWHGNTALLTLVAMALVLQLTAVFLPAAQPFFHTVPPSWPDVLVGLGVAAIVLSAMDIEKAVRRLSRGRRSAAEPAGVRLFAGKQSEIGSG